MSAEVARSQTLGDLLDAEADPIMVKRADVDRVHVVRVRHLGRSLVLVPLSMTDENRARAHDLLEPGELETFDEALAAGTIW